MTDNAATTEGVVEQATAWPICNPDLVLESLRSLKEDKCPEKKKFFPSYGTKWTSLSDLQKNKVKDFFNKLTIPVQQCVVNHCLELERQQVDLESTRSENTSKHDRARLIHLWMAPSAQTHWTHALSPLPRLVLDDRPNRKAPYDALADMFNNYEEYVFQNTTIEYGDDGKATVPWKSM